MDELRGTSNLRSIPMLFNMSVSQKFGALNDRFSSPVFIFGGQNEMFQKYLRAISTDSDLISMLELGGNKNNEDIVHNGGWIVKDTLKVLHGADEKYKSLVEDNKALIEEYRVDIIKNDLGIVDYQAERLNLRITTPDIINRHLDAVMRMAKGERIRYGSSSVNTGSEAS